MTLPICDGSVPPYKLVHSGIYDLTVGATPSAACQQWASNNPGWSVLSLEGTTCTLSHPTYGPDSAQVVQVCDNNSSPPDPGPGDGSAVQIQAINGYVTLTYVVGTQAVVVEPPPFTEEKMQDLSEGALLLMFALLVIYCSRALLDLLRADSIKD